MAKTATRVNWKALFEDMQRRYSNAMVERASANDAREAKDKLHLSVVGEVNTLRVGITRSISLLHAAAEVLETKGLASVANVMREDARDLAASVGAR